MIVTGTVVAGTSSARQSCRKTRMTISTSTPASNSVRYTSLIACRTNSVVSKGMSYTSPSGSDGLSRSIAARTCVGDVERVRARELEDGDAGGRLRRPSGRRRRRPARRARRVATSRRRVTRMPSVLTMMFSNCVDVAQAPERGHRELERLAVGRGRLAELAGRRPGRSAPGWRRSRLPWSGCAPSACAGRARSACCNCRRRRRSRRRRRRCGSARRARAAWRSCSGTGCRSARRARSA